MMIDCAQTDKGCVEMAQSLPVSRNKHTHAAANIIFVACRQKQKVLLLVRIHLLLRQDLHGQNRNDG